MKLFPRSFPACVLARNPVSLYSCNYLSISIRYPMDFARKYSINLLTICCSPSSLAFLESLIREQCIGGFNTMTAASFSKGRGFNPSSFWFFISTCRTKFTWSTFQQNKAKVSGLIQFNSGLMTLIHRVNFSAKTNSSLKRGLVSFRLLRKFLLPRSKFSG